MKFGLTENEYRLLIEHLVHPLRQSSARVFIFGSRANGKFKKFSDVDLLFKETDQRVSQDLITSIISFFEDSHFPYKIDLVNDSQLAASYRENVERDMIELFPAGLNL
jgi:predicted nucleotidyltransferase